MQIYTKQLDIDIMLPDIPLKTAEFKAIYPMGKIPLLEVSTGTFLPESTAIAEYLEDRYTNIVCRPSDPIKLGITRATVSFANSHLGPSLFPLFKNMGEKKQNTDNSIFTAPLCMELEKLNRWMKQNKTGSLNIGDFALASNIWYATTLTPLYDKTDILSDYPIVNSWWDLIKQDQHIAKVLSEMSTGFSGFIQRIK